MKASKLTARGLAYVVRAVGRKIAKAHRAKQTPHGKQTVKKLMAHGTSTNSLELSGDTKLFDRVARKWNVDYAFYQTEPGKYLLFFKSGQADAMTACFSEYSRKVLDKAKSRQPTIPEQMKQAEQQLAKEKPQKEHIKEAVHTHDTYCRIVIRHASFDAARMLAARWKREISLEYLIEEKFVQLSTTDEYFQVPDYGETYPFSVRGQTILLDSCSLAAALARLPEQTQEEIFLYYFQHLTQKEIGEQSGWTRSTIGRHIRLALKRLKEEMEVLSHE